MMQTIFLVVHVLIAILLIGIVLLQRGKGADAGAAFGAGASGTVFGSRGSANFLSRSTTVLATLFFATSVSLAYLGSQDTTPKSLLEQAMEEDGQQAVQEGETLMPGPGEELQALPEDLPELPVEETPAETE